MKPEISEFSYGYAVTDELTNWQNMQLSAAPYFPSLFAEGNRGYDVMLDRRGLPLFLQFKVADFMKNNRAKEISRYGVFPKGTRFYRMHLRSGRVSNQHQLLIDLEDTGQEVFYVAPAFHQLDELNSAYLSHQACSTSVFISPSDIGPLNDNREHHVSYERNAGYGFRFSEEQKQVNVKDYNMFTKLISERYPFKKEVLREMFERLVTKMLKILSESEFDISYERFPLLDRVPSEKLVPYLARTYFGCQLILIYGKESNA